MSLISFKNYSFKYPKTSETTLKNIDLDIESGERVLIVGKSGCGKSTLTKCINGLNKGTTTGTLEIKHSKVGTILQDSDAQFVAQTVGEDIAFVLENNCVELDDMKERVQKISEIVDMDQFLEQKPQQLSGGQKQRVALAGILIKDSNILLFDEPLANLDPKTGESAIKFIGEVQKQINATVIIVEHRLEDVLVIDIDKIVVMDEGKIIAVDSPKNILEQGILKQIGIREPLNLIAQKYADVKSSDSKDVVKEKLMHWVKKNEFVDEKKERKKILSFKDVKFKYDVKPILKGISFDIHEGEMLSIVGKNGAGKSTIAKVLCGFEEEFDGEITLFDRDIKTMSIKERADYIGYVMQNPNHMISKNTVKEEVEFSLRLKGLSEEEIEEKTTFILKLCGIYNYRNWPITMISYGQKKRVTIASILVLNPKILILDEPTAAQDYTHYLEIMEFLKELNEKLNITIIMVTHDMHLMLEYTKRAIVLLNGRIIFDGSSIKALINNEVLDSANLKLTSLYTLAREYGLDEYSFVSTFINYEKELRK